MRTAIGLFCSFLVSGAVLQAAPYASNVRVADTNVSFVLNEPATSLAYRINNGPYQTLDGSIKGVKTFSLTSPTDTFSILAGKKDTNGFTIPTGDTIATNANGLSQPSNAGGYNPISDDDNLLTRFNSPRGVSVNNNPQSTNFGTAYIANSAGGTAAGLRSVGDGLYALNADQSDAFGYGDAAQNPGVFSGGSSSSPFRVFVATNGEVYVADFSDVNGNVYRLNSDLTAPSDGAQVFDIVGGPSTLPAGQTHGSSTAVYVEGSLAQSNLVVWTIDEDLRSGTDDRNSLWRYDINTGPLPSTVTATKVNQSNVLLPLATSDMHRGANGYWYLGQNRLAGNETGIAVLDASGATLYTSLSASRTLLGNPTAPDILRNVQGIAVSEDQKWLAAILNDSFVAVVPLIDGIPDLANRLVVNTLTEINSGRDVAFDAVGNIHYVSSGQARYRVISPGGETWATLTWDGSTYSFSVSHSLDLAVTQVGGQIRLDWSTGVLQESTSLSGGWVDSAVQQSPYTFTPRSIKFFRVRSP